MDGSLVGWEGEGGGRMMDGKRIRTQELVERLMGKELIYIIHGCYNDLA